MNNDSYIRDILKNGSLVVKSDQQEKSATFGCLLQQKSMSVLKACITARILLLYHYENFTSVSLVMSFDFKRCCVSLSSTRKYQV